MKLIVVGKGKLANELLTDLAPGTLRVVAWDARGADSTRAIVIHAGSGREIGDVVRYCQETHSVLLELATGSTLEGMATAFPLVLCPNTNILMLKFMAMVETSGALFKGYRIELTESHQAQKTSTAGTAVGLARSLGLEARDVRSIRNAKEQETVLGIPSEHLGRHAYHHISIEDGCCRLDFETRVYGDSPYADGVARIVAAIESHALDNRAYDVTEFIRNGWL